VGTPEPEQPTTMLVHRVISVAFPNFAIRFAVIDPLQNYRLPHALISARKMSINDAGGLSMASV
jgi:hypothetical protein